ncbi:MAG: family 78 glycoside hydrolase catalytic domain [Oscillospiraceae bacterium]|nr:family 78 glycoside hydrolase catalytic domain [Oscillospiraceae bacterium]
MKAIRLRTEYLKDPLGIDVPQPRLMWNCEGGVAQTAYQIVTESWDSGKVESASMQAVYPRLLLSRERVNWKIRLWDENGEPGEWTEAFFEMGLLEKSDWTARWITGNYTVNRKERCPADCFKKQFPVRPGLCRARLYITACGLYEAKLGGRKVGNFCLAPGITDYKKRIQYQTCDVTELLHEGENTLTVQLADGWYRGSVGAWGLTNQYGTETKLLAQLEISYADGSRETVVSDSSWEWSNDGPIRFADNKDGEIVEAFRTPLCAGKAKETGHKVVPTASNNVPVTEHERFHPTITTAPNGKKLLDFGQNIAGYVRFRVTARVGQRMIWRFGEMLDAEGNLTQKNIQLSNRRKTTPLQKIDYTCGEGQNDYRTTFAVFGFQYAEVETDVELLPENIEAIAVYSDMEQTGFFESSNQLLNEFVEATIWSTKGNSLDIPTDCPTRERHGWTGDAQIFFETAAYLFDYAAFAKKYLRDVYDWQKKDGRLPQIAPYGGVDFYMNTMNGSVGWSDVGILMPYRMWKKYGDEEILREYYERMKKYAGFMIRRMSPDGTVRRGQSYGEWAEPADVRSFDVKDFVFPHPEESTAYTAYVLRCMAEIASTLGREADGLHFAKEAEKCRRAYQELVKKPGNSLDTDRQAKLVRPLYFDLLDEEQTAFAKKRLLQALENYGWRLGMGLLSTPLILDVLAEIDPEAAYRLLENEEMPGWLFMPKNGATTIWESWEGTQAQGGIASLNHYSKGAVVEWLFKTMCGIRVAGENRFVIAPQPGGHFTFARAVYQSVYGKVASGWEKKDGKTLVTVTVPANCSAEIVLPRETRTVTAGTHVFAIE